MTEVLKLSSLRINGGTQLRAETDHEVVQRYAQDMLAGDVFPPVVAYRDETGTWLSDGFHRYLAVQLTGSDEIEVDVRQGSLRDALLYAAEANRKHGLQLTNKDKHRMVSLFLNDAEWAKWSDREIARRCGVSHPFVSRLRQELTGNGYQSTTRIGGDGRTYNTTNIGSSLGEELPNQPMEIPEEEPDIPEEQEEFDFMEWLRGYCYNLGLQRRDVAEMLDAYRARWKYVKKWKITPETDKVLGVMWDEITHFLFDGREQYYELVRKEKDTPILNWDAEEQELHELVQLEKTVPSGVVGIAYALGAKLNRFEESWIVMTAIQERGHLPLMVENALHVGKILREVQEVLPPEVFSRWIVAPNGAGIEEKYAQALLTAIDRYEENRSVSPHEPDNQMLLALIWYHCVFFNKKGKAIVHER